MQYEYYKEKSIKLIVLTRICWSFRHSGLDLQYRFLGSDNIKNLRVSSLWRGNGELLKQTRGNQVDPDVYSLLSQYLEGWDLYCAWHGKRN